MTAVQRLCFAILVAVSAAMAPKRRQRDSAHSGGGDDEVLREERVQPSPQAVATAAATHRDVEPPRTHVLTHFAVRQIMRDLDPTFELSDIACEVVLREMDVFFRAVLLDAAQNTRGAPISADNVQASMLRLYGVELPR